jgi:preprotein translocase subunit SecG
MNAILLGLHIVVSTALVLVVLMQSGKGGGLSGAFGGGGGGQTLFGGAGAATFLNKATVGLAAGFMVTSLLLAVLGGGAPSGTRRSVLQETSVGQLPVTPPVGTAPSGDGAPGGQPEAQDPAAGAEGTDGPQEAPQTEDETP